MIHGFAVALAPLFSCGATAPAQDPCAAYENLNDSKAPILFAYTPLQAHNPGDPATVPGWTITNPGTWVWFVEPNDGTGTPGSGTPAEYGQYYGLPLADTSEVAGGGTVAESLPLFDGTSTTHIARLRCGSRVSIHTIENEAYTWTYDPHTNGGSVPLACQYVDPEHWGAQSTPPLQFQYYGYRYYRPNNNFWPFVIGFSKSTATVGLETEYEGAYVRPTAASHPAGSYPSCETRIHYPEHRIVASSLSFCSVQTFAGFRFTTSLPNGNSEAARYAHLRRDVNAEFGTTINQVIWTTPNEDNGDSLFSAIDLSVSLAAWSVMGANFASLYGATIVQGIKGLAEEIVGVYRAVDVEQVLDDLEVLMPSSLHEEPVRVVDVKVEAKGRSIASFTSKVTWLPWIDFKNRGTFELDLYLP